MKRLICLIFGVALLAPLAVFAEPDAEGCKDHPLFTRMNNYYIVQCEKIFDQALIMINEDPDSPKNLKPEGDEIALGSNLHNSLVKYFELNRIEIWRDN